MTYEEAKQRKADAGAAAIGILSAMLRSGSIDPSLFEPASKTVRDYLDAERDCAAHWLRVSIGRNCA